VPERSRIRAGGVVVVIAVLASLLGLVPAGRAGAGCWPSQGRAIRAAADPRPRAELVFRGHGSGHGLGMSQYGAQGAARLGCGYRQILTRYYRGTRVRIRPMPTVVTVRMTENASQASVTRFTGVVEWRNGARRIHVQRAGTVTVRRLSATRAALRSHTRRLWVGRVADAGLAAIHRRGVVRLDSPTDPYGKLPMSLRWDRVSFRVDSSGMDVVKVFGNNRQGRAMDKYLLGLSEVPSSWPRAALRAQAVAARSYAAIRGGAMLPTVAHQNYTGYEYEAAAGPRWRNAVWATSRRVVVDRSGRTIDAVYSSSMAGFTEDKVYSWGGSPISYLRPVNDARWTRASDNPASTRAWTRGFTRRRVATALGFRSVGSVFVYPRGDPRRVRGVRVIGVRGGRRVTVWIDGFDVRNALGLLSPGFTVKNNR
jgi:stage II sporulation protein D